MARFLFAWELGANFGHLARDVQVADRLRAAGHRVFFAVRNTRVAAELLDQRGYHYAQAPLLQSPPRLTQPPGSYAELLLAEGWANRLALRGCVRAWLALFSMTKPDVVVADHAPTALLAAVIPDISRLALGSGFEIPPCVTPLPSIRSWEGIPVTRLLAAENLVLGNVNAVVEELGGQRLASLGDLFSCHTVFTTFPELDHYGEREKACYVGSIHGIGSAASAVWPPGHEPAVFLYLRNGQKAMQFALEGLKQAQMRCVCVVPGIGDSVMEMFASTRMALHSQPVDVEPLLAEAAAVVSYGGAGMVAEALLAGVPLILLPTNVEQYLSARRVAEFGAGIVLDKDIDELTIRKSIERVCSEQSYRAAAQSFAARYRGYPAGRSADLAASAILAVLDRPIREPRNRSI